ncbi:MAG: phenylalanine--tRNA ligase subunit beta [Streptococcaceae bacterium]|jgi:phenylalanyl-tRNA synthetase beta chain|nr:phenylalanine--tRNA ligase subunit beta [Streptococcaceae bacterium]
MLVSYKWLKELVPGLTASAKELEEKMSITGIEVEGVTSPAAGLSKLVVGEILSAEDIPETHLHICQVNVGAESVEPLQIVCGAPNVRVGMKVITALVGARIGGGVKIKKGKMRGVESLGMLCALDELGVPADINPMKHEEGIYEMPAEAVPGEPIFPYLDMDDQIVELSITPNRADALSMRGVAYEVGAIYDLPVDLHEPHLHESLHEGTKSAADVVSVKVETDKVPTYKIRLIEGVKIAKSPLWLQNRLMSVGIKPINNVVDVTNYVLMYYGQPLHSFDFDKFGASEILVRQAQNGEKIVTLNGDTHELAESDIVITANGQPVALAGVMGGLDSEITDGTSTVALESAIFDGQSIRKTSQKFNLRSEASSRFEKGINQATVSEAADFAAAMIVELAGGTVLDGIVESNDFQPVLPKVSISLSRINAALGTDLSLAEVKSIFEALGFGLEIEGEKFTCEIPARRWDITIEADLVEEVARLYGYDKLPTTLPASDNAGERTPMQKLRLKVRSQLEAAGLDEVIGYSLTTADKAVQFTAHKDMTPTTLMLPMTEDRSTLRVNMITSLLDIVNYNQNRKNSDLSIYEIGNIFLPSISDDGRPDECPTLSFAISGNVERKTYAHKAVSADFYYAKGIVESLLTDYDNVEFLADGQIAEMHPGRTAKILVNGQPIGFVGQIHPVAAKAYDIKETFVGSLDMAALLEHSPKQPVFTEIPKIQPVTRDIAMLVKTDAANADIVKVIESSGVKRLTDIELFDVFEDASLGLGVKSMAYTLTFQAQEQSLTDEEVNKAMAKISRNLVDKLDVQIR